MREPAESVDSHHMTGVYTRLHPHLGASSCYSNRASQPAFVFLLHRRDRSRRTWLTHVNELFDFWLPQIAADLCSQQHAGSSHQLPVLLVEASLQHQLLKVNKSHRRGDRLQAQLLAHGTYLSLQAGGEDEGGVTVIEAPQEQEKGSLKVKGHLLILLSVSLM